MLPSRDECLRTLSQYGKQKDAAESLGISRFQFRRIIKGLNVRDYEEYRNRGTNQIPMSKGLVVQVPDSFDLFLMSDLHAGSEACDYDGLREAIARCKSSRNARMILGGDQMEMTPPGHHDGGRNSDSDPDHQIIRTAKALEPIKGKIDLIYSGNHGKHRFMAKVGIDPDLLLASMLDAQYSTVPTVVRYVTSKGHLKVCGGHGKSGGRNWQAELERMQAIYPNCNLYHLGHTHDLAAEQAGALEYDKHGDEYWSPSWLCRTGSFLKYAEYARYGFMKPKPTGYLIAKIRAGRIESVEAVKA